MTTSTVPAARNRYIDALRAAAIVRVVVYHAFGWAWLTVLLPAMGIMFALAGSLMAVSLEKHGARKAVTSRLRRLLPALWAFAAVAVPLMWWHGWSRTDPDHPLHPAQLLFWILPLEDPPGSSWGEPLWEVLWYLRAYLLFVLASPLLYFLYRRVPLLVLAAPLGVLAVLLYSQFRLPDPVDGIMWDFVTYCACWVAGFAYRDGRLARVPLRGYLAGVAALAAGGLSYLYTHPTPDGFDLNEVPVARTLWSLGFVLLVLRWQPALTGLDRVPLVASVIKFINARAVTIYLWHFPLISIVAVMLAYFAVPWATPEYIILMLAIETVMVVAAVVVFGWVEDVSASRSPRLWPLRSAPVPVHAFVGRSTVGAHRAVP
jgi:peptidoglycan/LPS O-acetylase OafA/YrhL